MPRSVLRCLLVGVVLAGQAVAADPASQAASPGDAATLPVASTFNDEPFVCRMTLAARRPRYSVYRLTYPSPVVTPLEANNTIPADYYLPAGIEPDGPRRPAVICLHILHGNFELEEMVCSFLASRGIPAVMIKLPYYGERSPPGGHRALRENPALLVEGLRQGLLDVRRTVDVLAARPEVDPKRIGVVGISMGGILAGSVAGIEPRIARAALILAGGDLEAIVAHARETAELRALLERLPADQRQTLLGALRSVDPLAHAAGLAERARDGRVLLINAAEDEVIPRDCTEKLARALGISDRVVWLEGLGHYSALAALPDALRRTADFFAADLPTELRPREIEAAPTDPTRLVGRLLGQLGNLSGTGPEASRCHFIDLEFSVVPKEGEKIAGRLRVVRGSGVRVAISAEVRPWGRVALGQGDYPWLAARDNVVFVGVLPPGTEPADPLGNLDEAARLKLRAAAGALLGAAMVPEMLERWVTIAFEPPKEPAEGQPPDEARHGTARDGAATVRIVRKDRPGDAVRIEMAEGGGAPRRIEFDVEGTGGSIDVRVWQFDTVAQDALFEPPGDLPRCEVAADDLYRVFSAVAGFALESLD